MERNLVERIQESVRKGQVINKFKSSDFEFLKSSRGFLTKYCINNPGRYNAYFERISRGTYRLLTF